MDESAKNEPSSEVYAVFDVNFPTLLSEESKKKPNLSSRVSIYACSVIERFDRVEMKVDRSEAQLSLLEDSSLTVRAIMDRILLA